jgi:hypothetical protein
MTEMYSGLHVGQKFSSLEDFKTVIRSISVRQHWDLRVVRSNKKSVVLGCRSSPSCYFRVVCRANKQAIYITSLQDSHSCRRHIATAGSTPVRSEASHVRFLLNEIPKLFDMGNRIKGQEVVEAVKRYHGYDISMRQAQRALTKLQPRQSRAHPDEDGDDSHIHRDDTAEPEEQAPGETSFDGIPSVRWSQNELHSTLMQGGDDMDSDDSGPEPLPPTVPQSQPPISHHAQVQEPDQTAIPHHTAQMNVSSDYQSHTTNHTAGMAGQMAEPDQSSIPHHGTQMNTSSNYQGQGPSMGGPPPPRSAAKPPQPHPMAAQLVLTNFKIEFHCTTCGALNQSFFPNQGNVTGGNEYIPQQQPVSNEAVSRSLSMSSVPNTEPYGGTNATHRANVPGPWAVPMAPTNS